MVQFNQLLDDYLLFYYPLYLLEYKKNHGVDKYDLFVLEFSQGCAWTLIAFGLFLTATVSFQHFPVMWLYHCHCTQVQVYTTVGDDIHHPISIK